MRASLLPILALAAACLAGCQPPNLAPAPGYADPYPVIDDPKVTVHDEALRAFLGFHSAVVTDDGQRPLMVEQPVRSLATQKYLIDYRIVFYDARGRQLEPVMGWTMIDLQPKQTVRLTGNALSTEATDYRVEVKWSNQ